MNRMRVAIMIAFTLVAAGAARVDAQEGSYRGHVTGQIGTTTGGDMPDAAITPAVSVSVHDMSGWGAEVDLGYANGRAEPGRKLDLGTLMANIIWLAPTGILRPYGVAGAGVIQVHGCFTACAAIATVYDIGVNLGGGVSYPVNDILGIRADVRYFWAPGEKTGFTRPANYGFWRAAVGVTFNWDIVP